MKDIQGKPDIKLFVDSFYNKVQKNSVLSPYFNEVVKVDWPHHLPKMYSFWETILLDKGDYKGNPIIKHQHVDQLKEINKESFETWLGLFHETIDELFEGPKAQLAKTRALSIATMIEIKLIQARG